MQVLEFAFPEFNPIHSNHGRLTSRRKEELVCFFSFALSFPSLSSSFVCLMNLFLSNRHLFPLSTLSHKKLCYSKLCAFPNFDPEQEEISGGYPFPLNRSFTIVVIVLAEHFIVNVNDKEFCRFRHRADEQHVDQCTVSGEVKITSSSVGQSVRGCLSVL